MALLALILMAALPPAAERFPWRGEVELVAVEVNGVRAYWGGAVVAEQPAAALRRLRAAYALKDSFVVEERDRVLFWHGGNMAKPGRELFAAIRKYGGPLALRVGARTGTPIASQAVWLADTACSLKLVAGRLCVPADLDALAAIAAAAIPRVDLQVVMLEREPEGTRLTWIVLPGAAAGPLLALLNGGGRTTCKRVPYPHPRAMACPLVVRLVDDGGERLVALLAYDSAVELRHAERELLASGWTKEGNFEGLLRFYREDGAQVDLARIERGEQTYLVYLGRRHP